MDLDDIFEQKHKSRNQHYDHNYRHEDDYGHENGHNSSHSFEKQIDLKSMMMEKLRNNPSLKKCDSKHAILLFRMIAEGFRISDPFEFLGFIPVRLIFSCKAYHFFAEI